MSFLDWSRLIGQAMTLIGVILGLWKSSQNSTKIQENLQKSNQTVEKLQEVHVMVNSQREILLRRIASLEKAITGSIASGDAVEMPEKPIGAA